MIDKMTKVISKIFVAIAFMALFSCSDSKVQIATKDNFEVVDLPDGSTAYLNNNSSIEYDEKFEQRVVRQTGEVFFFVTKGSSPFVVKTDQGEIKVLGTKFNVNSNSDDLEVEVEEGTVELKVNKFINKIEKGQKAFSKKSKNAIETGKANFKHKKWINQLNKDLKKFGKELNKGSKQIEKESKKFGKEVKKEFLKFKKKHE